MSTKADNGTVHHVVIVGAGPTGLLLAGELAAGGARPVILDRALLPAETPKAQPAPKDAAKTDVKGAAPATQPAAAPKADAKAATAPKTTEKPAETKKQ